MDALVAVVIVAAATVAFITTIITTVAIIAVFVISSPLARLDLHRARPGSAGRKGCAAAHGHGDQRLRDKNAWAASAAGYPAKAIGVARSDLEHCADLQATLRPEKSTSGVLSLSFIGSVFYASMSLSGAKEKISARIELFRF
jgi:hypothetical protein